jgi:hypothetical protein
MLHVQRRNDRIRTEGSRDRRFMAAVAIVICAGLYAFAAEQVTFILNNGERRSGEVIVAGADGANYVDRHLNLSGQPIPLDQVAVIDLTGGAPSALELSRVPQSSAQAVELRSGHAQAGKFVNIIRGDTLLWENGAGQQEQYALRDVSRIYLKYATSRVEALELLSAERANPRVVSGRSLEAPAGTELVVRTVETIDPRELGQRMTDSARSLGKRASEQYEQAGTRVSQAVHELTRNGHGVLDGMAETITRGVQRHATAGKTDRAAGARKHSAA